jgi:uncharacterized protein YggE
MSKSGIAAIVLAAALAGSARGQIYYGPYYAGSSGGGATNIEGITVAGKSTVMARPDSVEIDLSISAGSELTADAIVKYRDARRKLRDAFGALKLANVALEERGLRVDQKGSQSSPYFFDYTPNQRTKTEVQLSRRLVVRGTDLRKMDEDAVLQLVAKLLDVAQDAGGHVGPQEEGNSWYYYRFNSQSNSLVRFVIEDFDKLQEEAYEKAIAEARKRAERLARLSNVELGPVVAVREVAVPGDATPHQDDDRPRKRLETSKYQEIPVRVELLVRFDVVSKANPKGRTANP